jgi:hypothetical protein
MALINTIIQPVIKSVVQRVDGVIDIPFLLETYSDATAGYSLRDIGANGGAVVRVRNDSTSEQDFTASEVSDGTLASFCNGVGVGDGFVSIWYDQSGNGNHATQTSNSSQPKIVDGGVVVKSNNQPTISFGTNNNNFTLSTPLGIFNNLNSVSFFMVIQPILATTATQGILTLNPVFTADAFGINLQSDGTNFSYGGVLNNNTLIDHTPTLNENTLYSALTEGSNFKGFADGSNILTRSTVDIQPSAAGVIGTFIPGILLYGGTVSEIIVFDSGKANDRANIEENLANYYNITLS